MRGFWREGAEFDGGVARYFVDERRWVIEGGRTTFDPAFWGEGVAAPLYLTMHRLFGTDERLNADRSAFSSCDRPHPHYSLRARSAEALPGDRLILRGVGIYIGNPKLLGIGRYTISLKPRRRQNRLPITPDVGSDRYSGAYLRASVSLFDTRTQSADLLLDISERRGIGYGVVHDYTTRRF